MKRFQMMFDFITSLGAAVVIFGAWQKITHRPLADLFLTLGLLTESVIFVGYGIIGLMQKERIEPAPVKVSTSMEISAPAPQQSLDMKALSGQVGQLRENLEELNGVYSGILKAMRGRG